MLQPQAARRSALTLARLTRPLGESTPSPRATRTGPRAPPRAPGLAAQPREGAAAPCWTRRWAAAARRAALAVRRAGVPGGHHRVLGAPTGVRIPSGAGRGAHDDKPSVTISSSSGRADSQQSVSQQIYSNSATGSSYYMY